LKIDENQSKHQLKRRNQFIRKHKNQGRKLELNLTKACDDELKKTVSWKTYQESWRNKKNRRGKAKELEDCKLGKPNLEEDNNNAIGLDRYVEMRNEVLGNGKINKILKKNVASEELNDDTKHQKY
jgi:hypothetical protein